MSRAYHPDGSQPSAEQIFCFGSNLSGIHGAGAARAALDHYGAVWGVAEGRTGRSYAIPTVREHIAGPLTLEAIKRHVSKFLHHAETHPEDSFFVTRIGCGLAGHVDADVAPMFRDAPLNCSLPEPWREFIEPRTLGAILEAGEADARAIVAGRVDGIYERASQAACEVCNGTGQVFTHAADCDDDLCALNGDQHSCAGQIVACGCAAINRATGDAS